MGTTANADVARDIVIADRPVLARRFLALFEAAAREAIGRAGRFLCVVTGGSVADAFLPELAGAALDWSRVELFWSDERAVAPDDPASNYGQARRVWLDRAPAAPGGVHPMPADVANLDRAADAYAGTIAAVCGGRPFDLVLLGMGPDGHVCSLFPGHPLLDETVRSVRAIVDAPKPPPRRVTLTIPALAGARRIVVAAFGSEKAPVAAAAFALADAHLPVVRAARAGRETVALLDPAAAADLASR